MKSTMLALNGSFAYTMQLKSRKVISFFSKLSDNRVQMTTFTNKTTNLKAGTDRVNVSDFETVGPGRNLAYFKVLSNWNRN